MVKISELSNWAWIWWTEQVPVNDSWTTVIYTVDQILARTHNHTTSQITDLSSYTGLDSRYYTETETNSLLWWKANTTHSHAISDTTWLQTALDWKASLTGATFTGDIIVPAETYWAWWNWSNEAPTKNDTYDKIETITSWQRTRVTKSTTEQRTSTTTMANDSTLTFSMSANTKYTFRARIIFEANTAPDIKIGYTWPTTPTLAKIQRTHVVPWSPTWQVYGVDDINTVTTIACTTGSYGFVEFEWIVHNASNAWTFAFQWAQNTSDPAVTQVLAGSYIEYISY